MGLILAFVFIAVFVVVVLIMAALGTGATQQTKQAMAMLDSALATTGVGSDDEVLDIRRQELLSSIPWLNRCLIKLDLAPKLRGILNQGEVKWTVGGLLLMSAGCFVFAAYAVYLRTDSTFLALVLGSAAASVPFLYVLRKRAKRFERFEAHLPDALDLIVGALRAGHSLISAIGIVAREAADPIRREFRMCFDEQNFGVEFRVAMLNLVARVPVQDLRIVVTAMLIQKESGGNLAEVLEKVGQIIRDRYRLKRQIRVHTAQGRLTGWILSVLPVVLGLGMYLMNPKHMSVLWERPIGIKMIYSSIVMTCIGALVIRKIIRIRV
ncbi:MAG TPA: type II secretion system F family protein [Bryobacteraceae bacterium]|nr:type II secretion system F family protein [Bryobacteraceae bacterium]